jgi:hypothetical protein
MHTIVTHTTALDFAFLNGLFNGLPRFEALLLAWLGRVNQVQINVLVAPFGERSIDRGLRLLVPMIRISQLGSEENLLSPAVASVCKMREYIGTFIASVFKPLCHGAANIGFIPIPGRTVDMAVPSLQRSKHCVITIVRSGLVDA